MEQTEAKIKNSLSPKEKAEALLDGLRKGKSTYDIFVTNFRTQYLIAGQTIEAWEKRFKLTIPTELDPGRCKELDIQLMHLNQEASFYKAAAEAIAQALQKGSESEYRIRFTAIFEEYKSKGLKIANATLESLAKADMDDVEAALTSANVAAGFWKHVLDHLTFCRKLLELAIIAEGVQAKATQSERYIDALGRKQNDK